MSLVIESFILSFNVFSIKIFGDTKKPLRGGCNNLGFYRSGSASQCFGSRFGIWDPVPFFTSESVIRVGKKSGSGIRIPDPDPG
jgi:hypothetical protein